jgi:hypothetical protein
MVGIILSLDLTLKNRSSLHGLGASTADKLT